MTATDPLPPGLPPESSLQNIAFVSAAGAGQPVLVEFPDPVKRRAVLSGGEASGTGLAFLSVVGSNPDDVELLARLKEWVEPAVAGAVPTSVMMTFQGVQVVWGRGRVAAVAPADRLDAVRRVLVEVSYYEAELRDVERELGERWADLEADSPLAFEFNERSVGKRQHLAERFQQILGLRARLARVTPHVMCPHVHPPTLASQVGERLRERTRMPQRLEFLGGQLEVFERVYESCGQRASDFMLARTGHTLEWVIIVLLLAQTVLVGFDFIASVRK